LSQADIDNSEGETDSVVNIATATGVPPSGGMTVSEPDTAYTTVINMPLITLEKSAASPSVENGVDPLLPDAGDEIDYTFEVTNTGNVSLTGVSVTDVGPRR
jgi:uncharacterized repeat protein (TIGR01451 family)